MRLRADSRAELQRLIEQPGKLGGTLRRHTNIIVDAANPGITAGLQRGERFLIGLNLDAGNDGAALDRFDRELGSHLAAGKHLDQGEMGEAVGGDHHAVTVGDQFGRLARASRLGDKNANAVERLQRAVVKQLQLDRPRLGRQSLGPPAEHARTFPQRILLIAMVISATARAPRRHAGHLQHRPLQPRPARFAVLLGDSAHGKDVARLDPANHRHTQLAPLELHRHLLARRRDGADRAERILDELGDGVGKGGAVGAAGAARKRSPARSALRGLASAPDNCRRHNRAARIGSFDPKAHPSFRGRHRAPSPRSRARADEVRTTSTRASTAKSLLSRLARSRSSCS